MPAQHPPESGAPWGRGRCLGAARRAPQTAPWPTCGALGRSGEATVSVWLCWGQGGCWFLARRGINKKAAPTASPRCGVSARRWQARPEPRGPGESGGRAGARAAARSRPLKKAEPDRPATHEGVAWGWVVRLAPIVRVVTPRWPQPHARRWSPCAPPQRTMKRASEERGPTLAATRVARSPRPPFDGVRAQSGRGTGHDARFGRGSGVVRAGLGCRTRSCLSARM